MKPRIALIEVWGMGFASGMIVGALLGYTVAMWFYA